MYDLNGDGVITKTELGNVLVAVCELMGIDMKLPVSFSLPKNVLEYNSNALRNLLYLEKVYYVLSLILISSLFRLGQLLVSTIFQRRESQSALI